MPYHYLRLENQGPVALLTLDNPATANAMDEDLGPELARALEALAVDEAVRAVVLTGAGPIFSGGGNLAKAQAHLHEHPGQGAGVVFQQYTKLVTRVVAALTGMPKPVVAAARGAASGAGLAWLLASDLVVLAQGTRLVPGFVAVGLVPAAGVTLGLGRQLGHLAAAETLMLGRTITAEQALSLGLAHRVVPPEQLLPQALQLAQELAQGPAQALAATKRLLNLGQRQGLMTQMESERRAAVAAADLPEFATRAARFRPHPPGPLGPLGPLGGQQ